MFIEGFAKTGTKTKELVKYLSVNDIAVIMHNDIDELAAEALIATGVKTVLNTGKSMTGRYASRGTSILVKSNILLFDTSISFDVFKDGDFIKLRGKDLVLNNNRLFSNSCELVNTEYIQRKLHESQHNLSTELSNFIDNTIQFAKFEKSTLLDFDHYPELNTLINGRCAIVVVRSAESSEHLSSLKNYIEIEKPVLIGVDGGADTIISCGFTPDILIGDMDSVSDVGIYRSKELILHAYADGYCPCLDRIKALSINYRLLPMPGTSEDIALLLAYDKGASNIVLIGSHSCMIDSLERGRHGMGSSVITRFKVEERLIDYKHFIRLKQIIEGSENDKYKKTKGDLACGKM